MTAHSKMSRKVFLAGLATLVTVGCGSDSEEEKSSGTGGQAGSGTGGSGTGGSGTGGSGTGGSNTGGSPSGGSSGTGTGGGSAGSSTGGTGGGNPGACSGAITALIYANHDHELIIPLDDIVAGVEKEYETTGTANHCHRLTVTAADFATLASGGVVTLHSCSGTNHQYVLSCGTPPAPEAPDCNGTPNLGACN